MTAHAMVGDRQKSLDAGMNDYITKPLNVDKMFMTMAKWIVPAEPVKATGANFAGANTELDLPELPGIDVEAGLKIAQNMQAIENYDFEQAENDFQKLVSKFGLSIS